MALARVGIKGHLSMEKKICSSSSPTRCSRTKPAAKTRKPRKKKKLRKPGCHKPTPLRINLVLEIWLLREPSQTYRPSATCCFSDFFILLHIVPTVASNIFEGVYFTRSTVLTKCSLLIHHVLSCWFSILKLSDLSDNWVSSRRLNVVDTRTVLGVSRASFVVRS